MFFTGFLHLQMPQMPLQNGMLLFMVQLHKMYVGFCTQDIWYCLVSSHEYICSIWVSGKPGMYTLHVYLCMYICTYLRMYIHISQCYESHEFTTLQMHDIKTA